MFVRLCVCMCVCDDTCKLAAGVKHFSMKAFFFPSFTVPYIFLVFVCVYVCTKYVFIRSPWGGVCVLLQGSMRVETPAEARGSQCERQVPSTGVYKSQQNRKNKENKNKKCPNLQK